MTKFKNFYSPNFNQIKRRSSNIKYLIYHYTGMKSEISALKRLCDIRSKVSCHYFIKKNGEILQIVPDSYISWHAGKSCWKKDKMLNKSSIGIEIHNSGHSFNYTNFNNNQIISIKNLSNLLIKKYRIKRHNVLGHSDISPDRKKDHGEKFPWQKLNTYKIGIWHSLDNRLIQQTSADFSTGTPENPDQTKSDQSQARPIRDPNLVLVVALRQYRQTPFQLMR